MFHIWKFHQWSLVSLTDPENTMCVKSKKKKKSFPNYYHNFTQQLYFQKRMWDEKYYLPGTDGVYDSAFQCIQNVSLCTSSNHMLLWWQVQ